METISLLAAAASFAILACAVQREPDPESSKPSLQEVIATKSSGAVPVAGSSGAIAGFVLSAGASKFCLGAGTTMDLGGTMQRLVGAEGVIGTTSNGATFSVPNADAPGLSVPAFSTDPMVHNEHVLEYFLGAGLPSVQVGDVHATTVVTSGGSAKDWASQVSTFVAHNTVIDRKVQGIRIAGSYAWARFNKNDEVVEEQVFWPTLPGALLDTALALAATMSSPSLMAKYIAALPSEVQNLESEVVIHHTPSVIATVSGFASVDFKERSAQAERSFDASGRELRITDFWPQVPLSPKP